MIDQNIVILFSTLLGGAIAMLGSYVATRHTDKLNREHLKSERLKETLEKIYILVEKNEEHFFTTMLKAMVEEQQNKRLLLDMPMDVNRNVKQILMLVNLYVPSMKESAAKYNEEIAYNSKLLHHVISNGELFKRSHEMHDTIIKTNERFIAIISATASERGYGDT